MIVVETERLRALRFDDINGVDQSIVSLDDPASVPMEYVRYAGMGLLFVPEPRAVLMIGLGGGSFSDLMHRVLPNARVDVVEINPVVIEAAKRFFGLVEDGKYRVHLADGAAFVRNTKVRYDIVLADGGTGDGLIPEHLTTDRYFSALRERLTPQRGTRGQSRTQRRQERGHCAAGQGGVRRRRVRRRQHTGGRQLSRVRHDEPGGAGCNGTARARRPFLDGRRLLPYALAPLAAQLGRCPQ